MDENLNDNSELESEESLIPISGMYKIGLLIMLPM